MNQQISVLKNCAKCGGMLTQTVTRSYSLLDIFGVATVGAMVFGFLGLIIFSSHGRGQLFFVLVGALVAFGLYHMVGYKHVAHIKCRQCGEEHDAELSA